MYKKKKKKNQQHTHNSPLEANIDYPEYWINKLLHIEKKHGDLLHYAPKIVLQNEELTYLAFLKGELELADFDKKFLANKNFILKCIENYKLNNQLFSLYFLDKSIVKDREINLAAYRKNSFNYVLSVYNIFNVDVDFLKEALQINGLGLEHVKKIKNFELTKIAFEQNASSLQWARKEYAPKLCKDIDRIKKLLDEKPFMLEHVSAKLKNDLDFCLPYLTKNPALLAFTGNKIRDNEVFMRDFVVKHSSYDLFFLSSKRLLTDSEYCFDLLQVFPHKCYYIDKSLKYNDEFNIRLLRKNPAIFSSVRNYCFYSLANENKYSEMILYYALAEPKNLLYIPSDILQTIKNSANIEDNVSDEILCQLIRAYCQEQYLNKNIINHNVKKKLKL